MTAMTGLQVPYDGWTTDDLPDADFSYELVDGALLVTPPPHLRHSVLANELSHLLAAAARPEWGCAVDPGVRFDLRNYREPDVVLYRRSAIASGRLEPGDVLLAVEVVSPSSVSTDRLVKPVQYAGAGIAHFWRLEPEPLELVTYELVTYELDVHRYRETGRFHNAVALTRPVQLEFRLGQLLDPDR